MERRESYTTLEFFRFEEILSRQKFCKVEIYLYTCMYVMYEMLKVGEGIKHVHLRSHYMLQLGINIILLNKCTQIQPFKSEKNFLLFLMLSCFKEC